MTKLNEEYQTGALWRTREKIYAHVDNEDDSTTEIKIVPKDSYVMLLAYYLAPHGKEYVKFLWNEEIVIAFEADVGLMFDTNPDGINSRQ